MKLYLSIDLESWVYPDVPPFNGMDSLTKKREDNGFLSESIDRILTLLAKYKCKVTFFAIAEGFEWYPDAFRRIIKEGHEIAYHTHRHTRISSADVITKEISASREFLDEFKPIGFRAPAIYLPGEAIKPLVEAGFRYSSSVYGSYMDTFKPAEENFFEFPVSSVCNSSKPRTLSYPRHMTRGILFKERPFGSGYCVAALRLSDIDKYIEQYFKVGKPVFMFVHSWQITQPKDAAFPSFWYKLRHPSYLPYTISVAHKIEYLLKKYDIGRMDELL